MVRTKVKSALLRKIHSSFKTKNKLGREGRRRTKIRWRGPEREMFRCIASYIKTARNRLVNATDIDVLSDAGWAETNRIKDKIRGYLPKIAINTVKKVNNPYIAAMYELKKEEYRSRIKSSTFSDSLQELELFHCTKQSVVGNIVEDNLDWRRVCRCRFGRGNCFSSDADYANCHASRSNGEKRVLILCKVLVCNKTLGSPGLDIPPEDVDTTTGGRTQQIVYVKYNDNEFLPQYVAYYNCSLSNDVYGSKYNNLPRNWF